MTKTRINDRYELGVDIEGIHLIRDGQESALLAKISRFDGPEAMVVTAVSIQAAILSVVNGNIDLEDVGSEIAQFGKSIQNNIIRELLEDHKNRCPTCHKRDNCEIKPLIDELEARYEAIQIEDLPKINLDLGISEGDEN